MREIACKLEKMQLELENANFLMQVTRELLEDIPDSNDEDRGWKLENFCIRQNLVFAVFDAALDKIRDVVAVNNKLTEQAYEMQNDERREIKSA